jgi:predicted metal-dependent peptidase
MNARDILAASRVKVLNRHPYFDSMAFSLRMVEKPGLGTLAVDAGLRCYYDPAVVETWGVDAVSAVLLHEMGHVLRDHFGRMKDLDAKLANFASDLEINDDIVRMGWKLPGQCLMPKLFNLEEGQVAEWYYKKLTKMAKQVKAQMGDGKGKAPGAGGKCGGCARNPGEEGMGDGQGEGDKKDGKGGSGLPKGADPAEVNLIRKQVAQKIADHVALRGRGSVPGTWAAWAEEQLEPPVIPWNNVLRAKVRTLISFRAGQADYTSSRIARTYWGMAKKIRNMPLKPGMHSPKPRVSLVIDCSGSMTGKPYHKALCEVMGVVKAVGADVTAYATDAAVQAKQSIFSKKDLAKLGFSGGGTDMTIGIKKAEEDKPDVIVVITDGDTPWPGAGEMPRAKLIACIIGGHQKPPKHIQSVVEVPLDAEDAA